MSEILLIEDDNQLRKHTVEFLNREGFQTEAFGTGNEGFSAYKEMGCDVVLLDVHLPDLKGTEVLKKMMNAFACHPPIIIVTGHADKQVAIEALKLGAFDFLEKPFRPQDLKNSIERALTQKKEEIEAFHMLSESMGASDLTSRESEVAVLAAQGLSNEEIGIKLNVSAETVKTHLRNTYRKFGVDNRTALGAKLRNKR